MLKTFVEQTGPLLYPLLFLSIVSLGIVFERCWFWIKDWMVQDRTLRSRLRRMIADSGAVKKSRDRVAHILFRYLTDPASRDTVLLAAQRELRRSRGPVGVLNLIATVSTSFGLLGTVVGVSISFKSLAMGDPTALAEGLAIALNTTIAGLVVFLFSYIAASFFNLFSTRLTHELEEGLNDLKGKLKNRHEVPQSRPRAIAKAS